MVVRAGNNRKRGGFRFDDGLDPDVEPVERQDLLELMGERQVSVVERLVGVDGRERTGASRRAGGRNRLEHQLVTFTGSWADVALDMVHCPDGTINVYGLVMPGDRVDLEANRDYLTNCIANLWSRPTRSNPVSQLGSFEFVGVQPGPAELAISCGGHLLLADLSIE